MDANERAYLAQLAEELREATARVTHPGRAERKIIGVAKRLEEICR